MVAKISDSKLNDSILLHLKPKPNRLKQSTSALEEHHLSDTSRHHLQALLVFNTKPLNYHLYIQDCYEL